MLHAGPTHGRHHDGQPTCRRRERTVSAGAQRFRHIADGLPKMQSPRFFFIQPPIPSHNRQSSCDDTNPATGTARRGGKHKPFRDLESRGGETHKDIGACKSPAQLRPTSRRHPTHSDTITLVSVVSRALLCLCLKVSQGTTPGHDHRPSLPPAGTARSRACCVRELHPPR